MNIAPTIQPTLSLQPQLSNEFHFAEDTDSRGCCCCWRSNSAKPAEYYINSKHELEPFKRSKNDIESRIRANQRLAKILQGKLQNGDPIEDNRNFEDLRGRINHSFEGDPITPEILGSIITEIDKMRHQMHSPSPSSSSI